MFPLPLRSIINEAQLTEGKERPTLCTLYATIITPVKDVPVIRVESLMVVSDFFANKADAYQLVVGIQPGVFQFDILPYRDNLIIEVVEQVGLNRTAKRFRANPQGLSDAQMLGNTTQMSDMRVYDDMNFISATFQLLEIGFDLMRNSILDYGVCYMANPYDVLHNRLTSEVMGLVLDGVDKPKGIDIEAPIDNIRLYKQIIINQGTRLIDLGHFLQAEYGLYSTGQGAYYRNGYFFVYPLFKMGRYENAILSADIIRVPTDKVPTLDSTFYKTANGITILSSGEAEHEDATDITQQNQGIGMRILSSDAVSGGAGMHVNNGRAVTTRSDSVTEYKTNDRGSGNDKIPISKLPTDNIYKELSKSAANMGSFLKVPWNNADPFFLNPLTPIRYYYMVQGDTLKMREGNLTGIVMNYQPIDSKLHNTFRKHCDLTIFVGSDEVTV